MKKIYKLLIAIVAIIVIFLFFLPTIVKNYTIKNSKELIGAQIDINKLKYNYFTSTVRVYDFKLFEQNDTDQFITLDTLLLDLEPLQLIKGKVEVEQLYVKGFMVNTILKDSVFNFDDLLTYHSKKDTVVDTSEEEPFKFSVSNIEFKDSNLYFDNRDVGSKTHLKNLSFSIPYIGWDQEQKSNADVKFNFENGGYFESSLNINPIDGEFDANITINNLILEPFYEYLLDYADINSFNGLLNCRINVHGNTNEAIKSIVSGHVDVSDFVMTDRNDQKVLGSDFASCYLNKVDYFNESYELDSLEFLKPYIYLEMDSTSNTMFRVFEPYLGYEAAKNDSIPHVEEDTISNMYYAINHLIVNEGFLDYSDNFTGEKFDYHLSKIKINSDSIFSDSKWIDIESNMLLNNRGTLDAVLGFNPNNYMYTNLDFTIENFLLSDINIYANHYTGHNILDGDFYYYSNTKIVDGKLVSENKLLIKNVSVTSDKKGIYSLPLKFAIFLLKDKNGNVNLDIPVRGDLNDPRVSVGKLIWSTVKNLIVKVVASPVKFLSGLVGANPKELEEIKLSYIDTTLSDKNKRQLNKLVDLEEQKSGLKIELSYLFNPKEQELAIATDEIGKQYLANTKEEYTKNIDAFRNYVFTKIGTDSLSLDKAILQLAIPLKIDSIANLYNEVRMQHTRAYLYDRSKFTKIEVKLSDSILSRSPEAYPKYKINYSMKED